METKYVYEDGYGDDDLPIYLCPDCYEKLYEHQEICDNCKQHIAWENNEEDI